MDSYSQSGSGGPQVNNPSVGIELNGWTEQHEEIFAEWADKAMCYRWLHNRSLKIFEKRNALYTIPVIIMSTISGTASFALENFPENYKLMAQMAIGSVNITAGILTTVQQFLKITQKLEAHRVSCLSWGKFCQDIKVELTKNPKDRDGPLELLKTFKDEFDRLTEISPDIEDSIIAEFKNKFGSKKEEEMSPTEVNKKYTRIMTEIMEKPEEETLTEDAMEKGVNRCLGYVDEPLSKAEEIEITFSNYLKEIKAAEKGKSKNPLKYLKKPDICDELISANESRRNWYNVTENKNADNNEQTFEDPELLRSIEKRKEREIYKKHIEDFKQRYNKLHGRNPFDNEIVDNLKDVIPMNLIDSIIRETNQMV